MHIRLAPEFIRLNEVDLRAHANVLDRILHLHLSRTHLVCLTPVEVVKLRTLIQFGPQAQHALNAIARRTQDYIGSSNRAELRLVLLPSGSENRPRVGADFFVKTEEVHTWLESAPALYVENGITDGSIYNFLIAASVKAWLGSAAFIWAPPFHGGGDTLAAAIAVLVGNSIQGMCVVDRDSTMHVPPYPGDTGAKAHAELSRMGVVDAEGVSVRNPFFFLNATHGWGLENYIGPHLLDAFFAYHPEAAADRPHFVNTFPRFPKLTDEEMTHWWSINFKSRRQESKSIKHGLARLGGKAIQETFHTELAKLVMPENAVGFVAAATKPSRFNRQLLLALAQDMKCAAYRNAILEIGRKAHVAFAADANIGFA